VENRSPRDEPLLLPGQLGHLDHLPRKPPRRRQADARHLGTLHPHPPSWPGGENAAAEDANDHTHPGWRDLPVVERPPQNHGAAAHPKALSGWRKRWEPLLPAGWLERGGPIRTQRGQPATRHVPGGAPGGGYDMSAGPGAAEHPGGQLGLF
jgi:hypothetical protein